MKIDIQFKEDYLWVAENCKKCPKCGWSIEKNEGCNHMTCRLCHHEYCWLCSQNYNSHNGGLCVKLLKEKLEESRISVRQVRTATLEDIENKQKSAILTEDEKFRAKEDLQKLTNDSNSKLEEIFKKKEAEVMG
jgi:ariadne-1